MTLEEALAFLATQDKGTVVEGLQRVAQPVFQEVFNKGAAYTTARHTQDKSTWDGEKAGLTEKVRDLESQIASLNEKTPTLANLRTQHEAQIADLQKKHTSAVNELKAAITAERLSNARSNLVRHLVSKGVDPDYAEVLSLKPEVAKRLKPSADGVIEVLQADSEIPITAAAGKDVLDVLADELRAKVQPKFVTSNVDQGNGTPATGGNGTGTSKSGNYDTIRKEVQDRQSATGKTKPASERMGIK